MSAGTRVTPSSCLFCTEEAKVPGLNLQADLWQPTMLLLGAAAGSMSEAVLWQGPLWQCIGGWLIGSPSRAVQVGALPL